MKKHSNVRSITLYTGLVSLVCLWKGCSWVGAQWKESFKIGAGLYDNHIPLRRFLS